MWILCLGVCGCRVCVLVVFWFVGVCLFCSYVVSSLVLGAMRYCGDDLWPFIRMSQTCNWS